MDEPFNESILRFLKTGEFNYRIGDFYSIVKHKNELAINSTDFIGINYYSHFNVKINFFPESIDKIFIITPKTDDIITEMKYPVYAEGLYRGIKRLSKLNVPIIVTENGAPDSGDKIRRIWLERYLYSLFYSMKSYNIKGIDCIFTF
jgi:beta-glucosidase/6-phospho-beta-glucosidase/beta-galactosidase